MINTLLEHVPIKMEAADEVIEVTDTNNENGKENNGVGTKAAAPTASKSFSGNKVNGDEAEDEEEDDIDEEDEDDEEEDDEEEEEDEEEVEDEVLAVEQEVTMLISSDEEAELEAQRIRFPEKRSRKKSQDSKNSRSNSRNSNDSSTSSRGLLKNKEKDIRSSSRNSNNSEKSIQNLEQSKPKENVKEKQQKPEADLKLQQRSSPRLRKDLNNKNVENLMASTVAVPSGDIRQTLRRQSNMSTCSVVSSIASDSSETESCGNIYVYLAKQIVIFNCEFCDLKYRDLEILGIHLHESHRLFMQSQDEDHEKENSPRIMRNRQNSQQQPMKTQKSSQQQPLSIKKEPLHSLTETSVTTTTTTTVTAATASATALPPDAALELDAQAEQSLESCGNVFILNNRKLFLICGYCEGKYANKELFEKHLRQQHDVFDIPPENEVNVVPKMEIKEEVMIVPEAVEKLVPSTLEAMVSIPAEIPLDISTSESVQEENQEEELTPEVAPTSKETTVSEDSDVSKDKMSENVENIEKDKENAKDLAPKMNQKKKSKDIKNKQGKEKEKEDEVIPDGIEKAKNGSKEKQKTSLRVSSRNKNNVHISESKKQTITSEKEISNSDDLNQKDLQNVKENLEIRGEETPLNEDKILVTKKGSKEVTAKVKESKPLKLKQKTKSIEKEVSNQTEADKSLDKIEEENKDMEEKEISQTVEEESGKNKDEILSHKEIHSKAKESEKLKILKEPERKNSKKKENKLPPQIGLEIENPIPIEMEKDEIIPNQIEENEIPEISQENSNKESEIINQEEENIPLENHQEIIPDQNYHSISPPPQNNIITVEQYNSENPPLDADQQSISECTISEAVIVEDIPDAATSTVISSSIQILDTGITIAEIPVVLSEASSAQLAGAESFMANNSSVLSPSIPTASFIIEEISNEEESLKGSNKGKSRKRRSSPLTENEKSSKSPVKRPKRNVRKLVELEPDSPEAEVLPKNTSRRKTIVKKKENVSSEKDLPQPQENSAQSLVNPEELLNTNENIQNSQIPKELTTEVLAKKVKKEKKEKKEKKPRKSIKAKVERDPSPLPGAVAAPPPPPPQSSSSSSTLFSHLQSISDRDEEFIEDPVADIIQQIQQEQMAHNSNLQKRRTVEAPITLPGLSQTPTIIAQPVAISPNMKPHLSDLNSPVDVKPIIYVMGERHFACDQCPRSFKKHVRLIEHKRLHTGEKPFECDECGKRFRIRMRLNEHKLRHSKERKFICEICNLGCCTKQDLNMHMRHHNNDRRFKCTVCPKAFVRSSDLKIHVRVHTGEKPYVCDICHKCFRANQNLSVHRKSHMGEASKNFKCEFCEKKFMRNLDRKIHMRTHTGERPFKCEICGLGYSSRFNVRAHIERDHIPANGVGTPPRGKKKPGPKPKGLKEELEKQRKLIEELQAQLKRQIKTDEVIIPDDHCLNEDEDQQSLMETNETSTTPEGFEIIHSPPLVAIPSPPCLDNPYTKEAQKKPQIIPTPPSIIQKMEKHGMSAPSTPLSLIAAASPQKQTTTKVVSQQTSLGIQQVSVTVSMQVENVTTASAIPEKDNSSISNMQITAKSVTPPTSNPGGGASVKKERKITSYFTVLGQKSKV